ncbi:transporter substrate-binding domain-containing protein [uncultured Kiloniella sp.]|uniref:substrate-binding periplasmic protein n=1 Tax=uncultured Kiloniella sp. TaxID=1133091 RepID=UPI0026068986|nr:transporter substrate-binding domain-containing protein [uncultured Kiloniella sp.]
MWQSIRVLFLRITAICLLGVILQAEPVGAAGDKLVISRFKNADGDKVVSYVLERIYNKIGYEITFADYPGKKSLVKANAGEADGESMRRAGLASVYPNLIQLSHPHVDINFRIYTKHGDDFFSGFESWKNSRIGIVRGVIALEEITKGLNPVLHNTVRELFDELNQGNIDVAIATDLIGGLEVFMNHPDENIRTWGGILKTIPLYHYVHKRNASLVPALNKEIERLRKNGELQKLYVEGFDVLRAAEKKSE